MLLFAAEWERIGLLAAGRCIGCERTAAWVTTQGLCWQCRGETQDKLAREMSIKMPIDGNAPTAFVVGEKRIK